MSMFDAVRNNKRIVQVFLGLITLPFAFWGVDSYVRNSGAGSDLAQVGDTKITMMEFDKSMRDQQDRMRQQYGASFRPEMMNTPEVRLAILNELIDRRLILLEGAKNSLAVSDDTLRQVISRDPNLQEDGKFSMTRYEMALRAQGMSQPQYEAQMRQDIALQQQVSAVANTAIVSGTQIDALLRIQSEERQIAEFRLAPEQFVDKAKVDAAEVRAFYDSNIKQFEVPEQIKAEYIILSLDSLLAQVSVSDAELKAWYESHKDRYQQPEERRASHILIKSEGVDKDKARASAEEILKEVLKAPARFGELAKQKSDDPGSAAKGGDLGYFGRGMMVKAFEDSAFKLKEGEISGIVDSEFGFHIIKVTGIKGGKVRTFDEVRVEIESELKKQAAQRKFAEAAETFNNMVYEQADSLAPTAEKFKLKPQQSGWIARDAAPQSLGPLGNERVLAGLFSEDAIKNKRNAEAVEVAPNTLLAARVVEHVAAAAKPFDAVKAQIEAGLKARAIADMAKKAGEEKLAALKQGEDKLNWSPAKTVSRALVRQMPPGSLQAIFKTDASSLPAYVGVPTAGGYSIYKIVKVVHPDKIDENKRKAVQREFGGIVAQEDLGAYLAGLRSRYKVEVNTKLLESRERP